MPLATGTRSAAWTVSSTRPAVNTAEETRIVRGLPTEAQSARAPPTSGEMYCRPCLVGKERERERGEFFLVPF